MVTTFFHLTYATGREKRKEYLFGLQNKLLPDSSEKKIIMKLEIASVAARLSL